MTTPESTAIEIPFRTQIDQDYRLIAANGAWGGVSPRGDFVMHFYLETQGLPDEITYSVNPAGGMPTEVSRRPDGPNIVRRMQVGIVLSIEQAAVLAGWISTRLDEARRDQSEGRK